jgi:hypothetical protein
LACPGVALLSPTLGIEDLPVNTTPDFLLQEAKPMEVWKAYFENANIRAIAEVFGEENVEDEEDLEIVDTLDEASKSFQSPAKISSLPNLKRGNPCSKVKMKEMWHISWEMKAKF